MKLSAKGHFAPRPVLQGVSEDVASVIEKWSNVHARTHWELGDETIVDGADFYVGEKELGHIHLYAEAHVRMSRELSALLIAAKLAKPFRWSAAFVVHSVRTARDAEQTEWLFKLAYDRLCGVSLADLESRIVARAPATRSAGLSSSG